VCLSGICDYPYQKKSSGLPPGDTVDPKFSPVATWAFVGLAPQQSFNTKLKYEILEISEVFINPYSVLSCNL